MLHHLRAIPFFPSEISEIDSFLWLAGFWIYKDETNRTYVLSKRGGGAKSFYFEKLEKMQQNNFSELLRKKKAQCYQAKNIIRKMESLASVRKSSAVVFAPDTAFV